MSAPSLQEGKQLAAKDYEDLRITFLQGLFPRLLQESQVMKLNVENVPSRLALRLCESDLKTYTFLP